MLPARRTLLKGAGASVVASLFPHVAFSQTSALIAAPRRALVIGNNRYRDEPLKNPVNDANAIATELRSAGFQVTLALDAGLAQMRAAVDAFGEDLSRSKAVGLFYFAGHGVQLAWRNYLLPVDTGIDALEEVKDKAVDLGHLLDNMGRAGNPANLVILDACRNNPFGRDFRVDQKGLSQVDAPVGTLLAYATAPGNVALDGEGTNGLYTEHLLRELRVQDAKVEDVFKRVRLGVRRRSNGQQIPWESTSLEDDFYFLPPAALVRLAEQERQRRIDEEREAVRRAELAERERLAREEREAKVRADAERQRRLEEERRLKEIADTEARRKLAEEQELRRKAELEKERQLELERTARQQAEAARRRKLDEEIEARRASEAERAAREQKAIEDARRAASDLERRFKVELETWEQLRTSRDVSAIEAYLYRYPNGRFSELAQLRLDRLLAEQGEKRVQAVVDAANPYTKGTARANTKFSIGDSYTIRTIDFFTKIESSRAVETVTAITDDEVIFNGGSHILDLLGNTVKHRDGRRFTPMQQVVSEYAVGKKWSTRFFTTRPNGQRAEFETNYKVVGRETITVPAGTFDCFKVESFGGSFGFGFLIRGAYWIAPGKVKRVIASDSIRSQRNQIFASERDELVAFREAT